MRNDIVRIQGGLGNQMFQYAFYLFLKNKLKSGVFCELTFFEDNIAHNGFELYRVFGVEELSTPNYINYVFNHKFLRRMLVTPLCQWVGSIYVGGVVNNHLSRDEKKALNRAPNKRIKPIRYYDGYWQTELYIRPINDLIRKVFSFDEFKLNEQTKQYAQQMKGEEAVSVHIRRGDYLTPQNEKILGGICTDNYYIKAMNYVEEQVKRRAKSDNLRFYIFSNDVKWVTENLSTDKVVIVECNSGVDSWQDMYLMTCCKHNIVANSSFSWWGAWLNSNLEKIVVSPNRWFNSEVLSDEVCESWHKIEG